MRSAFWKLLQHSHSALIILLAEVMGKVLQKAAKVQNHQNRLNPSQVIVEVETERKKKTTAKESIRKGQELKIMK